MLAACLAYLATRQGDSVGFCAYSDDVLSSISPNRHGGGLQRILTELHRLRPRGAADHARALGHLAENLRRRGVVVVLSDLLGAEDALGRMLKRFRFQHHDCVVIQVLDPDELDFPFTQTTRFRDSESADEVLTAPGMVRRHYRQAMAAFLESCRLTCLELQVDYLQVASNENLGNILAAYLHRREALR